VTQLSFQGKNASAASCGRRQDDRGMAMLCHSQSNPSAGQPSIGHMATSLQMSAAKE